MTIAKALWDGQLLGMGKKFSKIFYWVINFLASTTSKKYTSTPESAILNGLIFLSYSASILGKANTSTSEKCEISDAFLFYLKKRIQGWIQQTGLYFSYFDLAASL